MRYVAPQDITTTRHFSRWLQQYQESQLDELVKQVRRRPPIAGTAGRRRLTDVTWRVRNTLLLAGFGVDRGIELLLWLRACASVRRASVRRSRQSDGRHGGVGDPVRRYQGPVLLGSRTCTAARPLLS